MTNLSPNTDGIKEAAQKKRAKTIEKVLIAIKNMESESIPINFNSVSNFTKVTKAWLYKQEEIKELIKNAKGKTNNLLMQNQAVQIKSKDREISILIKQNKLLRKQIEEIRQQLEVAYAEIYKHN
jgi:hypothetical protein